jgi:hypothetical protein
MSTKGLPGQRLRGPVCGVQDLHDHQSAVLANLECFDSITAGMASC